MKIGIVTFHAARNYGAVLQAYALQTYLRKIGHEPFFINYRFRWNLSLFSLRAWLSRKLQIMAWKVNDNILRCVFAEFRNEYLVVSPRGYSRYDLRNNPPKADAYICGSDQIWNPNGIHINDESAVWLNFGDGNVRRIAYAASFSVPDLDYAVCKRWSGYVNDFNFIGVREKNGVDLIKKLGRNDAVWVPDPTLLLDASDYNVLMPESKTQCKPCLFAYILGGDNDLLASKVIKTVHERWGLLPHISRPYSLAHNLRHGGFIGPDRWLSRLRKSEFVVTNSFHGLVFCLLFHRPFIVLLRAEKEAQMNSRVLSLLDVVGLQSRAISKVKQTNFEAIYCENIKWDMVDFRLKKFREKGCQFLREALA